MSKKKNTQPKSEASIERPSRSAKKRESTALQELGMELLSLSPADRLELNLPEELLQALAMHDRISDREGARRQRQFIGRLMRDADAERIRADLAILRQAKNQQVATFHRTEKWRDKLLTADESSLEDLLRELADNYDLDSLSSAMNSLRNLLAQARQLPENPNRTGAQRELFRLLARILDNGDKSGS